MSIGLYVTGRVRPGGAAGSAARTLGERESGEAAGAARQDDLLDRALAHLEATTRPALCSSERTRDADGRDVLCVSFHPGAEDVVLIDEGDGRVAAAANTATCGPGYHRFVCDTLRALGEALDVTWDPESPDGDVGDETGYFHSGDAAAIDRTFAAWLQGVARRIRFLLSGPNSEIALSMPESHAFQHDGAIATPLGPRDAAWIERVARDGTQGFDVFPWRAPGVGADYFLGRALVRMWSDVRWRPPLDEEERQGLAEVAALLEAAYRAAPGGVSADRPYPWREWAELQELLGTDSLLATRTKLRAESTAAAPPIGYRRRDVRVRLSGGWSLQVPGAFAESWDERGTWHGTDGVRAVWFTSFRVGDEGAAPDAASILAARAPLEGEPLPERTEGPVRSRAALRRTDDEGRPLFEVHIDAAVPGGHAFLTVVVVDEAHLAWAEALRSTLRHAPHLDARAPAAVASRA
jgi:hypothetical protein